jgi:hypothetical protein
MMIMGIDRLRLISKRPPCREFFEEINEDLNQTKNAGVKRLFKVQSMLGELSIVRENTVCRIVTRHGIEPGFFLQLNFSAFAGDCIRYILEFDPNKLRYGFSDLNYLLNRIFGHNCPDLKISRIDPCADIEMPVDFFRRCLRVPAKRKSTEFAVNGQNFVRTYSDRGITGFYIGASPAALRVYDKREEMKRLRENVDYLPPILTPLEWELRHRKCPISYLSEFYGLLDYQPFDKIEVLDVREFYDFHNEPADSLKRFLFNRLSAEQGTKEAIRILNHWRNFKRDYGPITCNRMEIKEKLNESYLDGVRRFFNNEGADVRYRYVAQDTEHSS